MSLAEATGYAVVTQALLTVVPQWGAVGIASRVRTGQIAIELLRPVDFVWMHFASRLGISAYYVAFRMLPLLLLGAALGLLPAPSLGGLALFAASTAVGAVVANAILFLVEISSFWLETERGVRYLVLGLAVLPNGLLLPLAWFPAPMRAVFLASPFPYTLHVPAEAWLGRLSAGDAALALAVQAAWAVALVAACRIAFARAARRLVFSGG
jgi:ABC-2 type transport system permease protein